MYTYSMLYIFIYIYICTCFKQYIYRERDMDKAWGAVEGVGSKSETVEFAR